MSLRQSPLSPARLEANRYNAKKSTGPRRERGKLVARTCSSGPRLFCAGAEEPQTLKHRSALRGLLRAKPLNI
jgi:hypothetical protein